MKVQFKILEHGHAPFFATEGAVCADCFARIENFFDVIRPSERKVIPLGFAVAIPEGYELVVRPRSGLSSNEIDVLIGTIDSDYRGEVKAIIVNNSAENFKICDGDRICQIALREVPKMEIETVNELPKTARGDKGFGSTGGVQTYD